MDFPTVMGTIKLAVHSMCSRKKNISNCHIVIKKNPKVNCTENGLPQENGLVSKLSM